MIQELGKHTEWSSCHRSTSGQYWRLWRLPPPTACTATAGRRLGRHRKCRGTSLGEDGRWQRGRESGDTQRWDWSRWIGRRGIPGARRLDCPLTSQMLDLLRACTAVTPTGSFRSSHRRIQFFCFCSSLASHWHWTWIQTNESWLSFASYIHRIVSSFFLNKRMCLNIFD